MKFENVINCLETKNLSCKQELETFISYYRNLLCGLYCQQTKGLSETEDFMIKELFSWVETEGNVLFYDTIKQLDEDSSEKVKNFIDFYSFLLENSERDILKLVDQLFFIPSQFSKDFNMMQQTQLEITLELSSAQIGVTRYIFNTKGVIKTAPYFFRRMMNGY